MPIMNTSAHTFKVSPTATGRELAGSSPEASLPLRNVSKEQWWESVLPPGQLAERLRTAQAGPSTVSLDEGPRSSRRGIVRNSSDRANASSSKHYASSSSSLRTSPMESPNAYLSPPSTAGSRTRAGTWSSVNSSHPSSSTRSSISMGDWSSASSSNDEGSTSAERVSPVLPEDWPSAYGYAGSNGDRSSGTTSPTYCISRSQTNRRRRVLANDDGVGLGVNIRGHKSNVIDLDERFHQWNSGLPFHPAVPHSASSVHVKQTQPAPAHASHPSQSALGLRPFPSSLSSSSSRHSIGGSSVFIETPDGSSDEDRVAEAQRMARRSGRTSSTLTTDTVRDVQSAVPRSDSSSFKSAPASRRSSMIGSNHHLNNALSSSARRVSFNQAVEVVQGNDTKRTQTIGHSHGRTLSSASDKAYRQRFHTHSSSRAANHAAEVRAHAHSHVRGQRTPCHSAPTSPKLAAMANLHKEHVPSRLSQDTRRATSDHKQDVRAADDDQDAAQLAILSSLSLATSQFSTARNLARALTRQLSAPIRPVLHLTLFASISSMAFVALAGFLVAGYLCTVWDDVNSRGKSLQKNVSSARQKIETRVQWTRSLLGAGNADAAADKEGAKKVSPTSEESSKSSAASSRPSTGHRHTPSGVQANATKLFTAPIKLAFSLPAAIIVSLTPEGIKSAYSGSPTASTPSSTKAKSSAARSSTRSAHHRHSSSTVPPPRSSGMGGSPSMDASGLGGSSSGFHNLPPRPPLSSLLPSIAFTIVIACGAGLASFFASRAAASSSSPMDDATSTTPMSSARATPNSSAPSSPHVRHHSRGASMTGRFDSHASSVHSSGAASSVPSSRRRSAQSISSLHGAGLDAHPSHAHYSGHARPLSFESRRSSLARHDVSAL